MKNEKARKKKPQDATMRNVRSLSAKIFELEERMFDLTIRVIRLEIQDKARAKREDKARAILAKGGRANGRKPRSRK